MVQSRIDLLTLLVTRIRLGGGLLDPEAISANCDLFWTHWTFIDRYIGVHEWSCILYPLILKYLFKLNPINHGVSDHEQVWRRPYFSNNKFLTYLTLKLVSYIIRRFPICEMNFHSFFRKNLWAKNENPQKSRHPVFLVWIISIMHITVLRTGR